MKENNKYESNIHSSLLVQQSALPQVLNPPTLPTQLIKSIGDNSYPHIPQRNLYDFVADFTKQFVILRPENKWVIAWHVLVLFVLIYYIFEIGLLLGFGENFWLDQVNVFYSVNWIFILILICDCFLGNLKAYYSHGLLVTQPQLIVKRYLKIRFYIDIIAILSILIPVMCEKYVLNWMKVFFFMKIYQIYQIDKQFIRVSQVKVSFHTFYLLSRLVFYLIFGSHYLGIWFYMVDKWVYDNNYYGPNTPMMCWIYNAESYSQLVLLQPWYGQYLYSMYFSIGTMTTIAYGDIVPLNPLSTLYITIALVAYTISFAYILSEILRILMEAQASKLEHSNNLLIVSNMMKNNKINQKTQSKVKSYFQKIWKQEIYRNREVQNQLIQLLPQKIKNQLFNELFSSFFNAIHLYFSGNEQIKTNFMVTIANSIGQQQLVQDHILYNQSQQFDPQNLNNHSYYFIKQLKKTKQKPSIEIGIKDLPVRTLTEGDVGIEGFYTGQPRDHWAKVILSVLVYYLPRKIFIDNAHLLTEEEKQNVFLVQEKIYQYKCYVCRKQGHNFKYCPFVTYQPDKILLLKYYFSKQISLETQTNKSHQKNKFMGKGIQQERKSKIHYNTLILSKRIKNIKYKVKDKYQLMLNDKYYRHLFSFEHQRRKIKKKGNDDSEIEKYIQGIIAVNETTQKINKKQTYEKEMKATSKLSRMAKKSASAPPVDNTMKQINLFQNDELIFLQQQKSQKKTEQEHNDQYSNLGRDVSFVSFRECSQQLELTSQSSSKTSDQQNVDLQTYIKQTQLYIRQLQNLQNFDSSVYGNDNEMNDKNDIQYDTLKQYKVYKPNENMSKVLEKYEKSSMVCRKTQYHEENYQTYKNQRNRKMFNQMSERNQLIEF